MKPLEELRKAFEDAGVDITKPIVTTCGSGVSALVLTLALYRLGVRGTALYDGSWAEWGIPNGPPVATGSGLNLAHRAYGCANGLAKPVAAAASSSCCGALARSSRRRSEPPPYLRALLLAILTSLAASGPAPAAAMVDGVSARCGGLGRGDFRSPVELGAPVLGAVVATVGVVSVRQVPSRGRALIAAVWLVGDATARGCGLDGRLPRRRATVPAGWLP